MRVIRSGDWEATIGGDLQRQIDAALGDAGRRIVEEVERETRQIYERAYAAWPVKSGASRSSLMHRTIINVSGEVRGEVRAGASYARYIQSWQIGDRGRPLDDASAKRLRALGVADPARQRDIARENAVAAGKQRSQASTSGSAMWLLLRWPAQVAGKRLTVSLRPVIEAALAGRLEG